MYVAVTPEMTPKVSPTVTFSLAVLWLAACGSAVGLDAQPGGNGGSGGSSGVGGNTTIGVGGDASSTTSTAASTTTAGGGWNQTVTVGTGGGWGTTVGTGGYAGSTPGCVPGQSIACSCTNGQLGAQVCQPDGSFGPCLCSIVDGGSWEQQQLARLRRCIVGPWIGTATNPGNAGCPALVTFDANGHYSTHSPADDSCEVLYYTTNTDSPKKTYVLDDVLASAEGEGEIEFWFDLSGTTKRGQIHHLFLSDDETVLAFEVWDGPYGPIVLKLKRPIR